MLLAIKDVNIRLEIKICKLALRYFWDTLYTAFALSRPVSTDSQPNIPIALQIQGYHYSFYALLIHNITLAALFWSFCSLLERPFPRVSHTSIIKMRTY